MPGAPGEVTGAVSPVTGCRTPAAGISAPMASLRAPGAFQGDEVGKPLRGVALSGKILKPCDLTTKRQPPELALGLLVGRMISKARAVGLRGRDRRGGNRWFMAAQPQFSVAIARAGLAWPASSLQRFELFLRSYPLRRQQQSQAPGPEHSPAVCRAVLDLAVDCDFMRMRSL